MGKIIDYHGEIPKRIGNLVFYKSRGQLIVRTNSGFTSEALKMDAKYLQSRNNASEFGQVSSLCKAIRVALVAILPKQNNWAVVNSFTKKMHELMKQDLVSAKGKRNLATAMENESARQLLVGYCFNPDTTIDLKYELYESKISLQTSWIVFPTKATSIGFRIHKLVFDFNTRDNQLQSSDWQFYKKSSLPNWVEMPLPVIENEDGVVFSILETGFYKLENGAYLPVMEELKSVRIVAIC